MPERVGGDARAGINPLCLPDAWLRFNNDMLRNIHPGVRFITFSGENGSGGQGNQYDRRNKSGETTAEGFHCNILTPLPGRWQDRFVAPKQGKGGSAGKTGDGGEDWTRLFCFRFKESAHISLRRSAES